MQTMNKTLLIIQREYLSRVKKKSFLLVTFLVPLLIIGIYGLTIFLTGKSFESSQSTVHVIDQTGFVAEGLNDAKQTTFVQVSDDIDAEKKKILDSEEKVYLLVISDDVEESGTVDLFSAENAGFALQGIISNQVEAIIRNKQLEESGIDVALLEGINPRVSVATKEITESGERDSSVGLSMGIAIALSILIYLALFLYGAQVMRGIIEEKNNRIVEVIISSVKPFQLMMGKILGIGLVGLTQFILWIVLSAALMTAATFIFAGNASPEAIEAAQQMSSASQAYDPGLIGDVQKAVDSLDINRLLICFFIFFIGGYLLYSALFAAVGSAVDNETESQQFMMPITLPLLFTYVLSFGVLINDPHGPLSVWLSMIPLTSPIAMLVRVPFGVPDWQIAVSAVLLVAGFVVTTWIAARIYRVGILMYGKKASYKEIIKWFRYKG